MRRRGVRGIVAGVVTAAVMAFAAPVASAAPWQCDAFGYLFQSPTNTPPGLVQQIDLATGEYSTLGRTAGVLNGVGYNVLDDYFYAYDFTNSTMVRIEDDLRLTPVPSGAFTGSAVGDVSPTGQYYGLIGTDIYQIDYAPGSPTYGNVIRTFTIGAAPPGIVNGGADWAWIDGFLYMIGNDASNRGHLLRIDPNTGARVDLTPAGLPITVTGVGAVYADANGYLYGSNNNDGSLVRIDPSTLRAITLPTATPAQSNDGARCAAAPIPTVTVTKAVDGRVRPQDQFTVGLVDPRGNSATSVTTTGTDTSAATDDWPVTQGGTYTITDAMAAGSPTPIGEYIQSIVCVDGAGNPVTTGGSAGRWTLLIANATDYVCTVTNRASADLEVTKSASPRPAIPGTNVTYTLSVTNNGPSTAVNARVTDPLPAGLTFVSASTGCAAASGTVTCNAGDLAPGATRTFTITAAIAADATGTLVNTATGTSDTPDPDPRNNVPREETPLDPTADLEIVKRALSDRLVPGRQLSYELTVTNFGPSTARDVRASDSLPRGLSFVSASEGCAFASGTVTCTAVSLASGRSITFRVVTRVGASVTANSIANTATVESPTRDPDPGNNTDRETVPSGPEADLSIVKIPSVDSVAVGGQLFYTLLVRNDGPSDAQNVVVTDTAGPGLTLLSAEGSQGASCSVTSGRVTCRLGTLAAGGSAQVLVSARVDQAGELTNTATVDSTTKDPDPRDNRDERRVTGDPPPAANQQPADLEIVKTANRRSLLGGGTITYTLSVRNLGPGTATDVQVIDTPSLRVKVRSVRTSAGRCTTSAPIRCSLGTLQSGAAAKVRIVAQPLAAGTLRNSASVTGDVPDPRADNNIDGTSTRVQGLLKIVKRASATAVRAGGTLTYKIRVTNASVFALRSVRVCDDLPSGLVFVSSTPKAKLVKGKRCWTIRALGANKSKTFTLKARVLRGAGGRKVNVATATAPNARGARSRSATGTAAISVLPAAARGGGVTG